VPATSLPRSTAKALGITQFRDRHRAGVMGHRTVFAGTDPNAEYVEARASRIDSSVAVEDATEPAALWSTATRPSARRRCSGPHQ
jgi:hypothetical protein